MKKLYIWLAIALLFSFLFIAIAHAEDLNQSEPPEPPVFDPTVLNIIIDFILSIINAPLQLLLGWVHDLMVEPVNTSLFAGIWSIITYILSLFYGLILLFIGFKFLFSGYSPEQRDSAKRSLTNIIILIILVQSSYIIYSAGLQLSGALTGAVFNLINPDFFVLTINNIPNIFLQFILTIPYVIQLILTLILLVLRYLVVICGVALFPIGIFCYFIEPLQGYGKLILNVLLVIIIIPFFYSLVFLASSMLLDIALFQNMKMILMISAFSLVNLGTLIALTFVIIKAALKVITPIIRVAGVVAKVAAL